MGVVSPRSTPKLDGHILSAVRDCLFNILHSQLPSISGGTRAIINKTRIKIFTAVKISNLTVVFWYSKLTMLRAIQLAYERK
jgi:hypothetical protein